MQKCLLYILPLLLLSANTIHAQRFSIYFLNNETELMLLERPNQLAIAYAISPTMASNVQVGYSPIKHLHCSLAYYGRNQKPNDLNRSMRRAYTTSVGAYFILGEKKNRNNIAEKEGIEKPKKLNKWLLNMQAGYSMNFMYYSNIPEMGETTISELDYNSLFCSFSLSHQHKWGLFTLSVSGRQLYYKKAVFEGTGFDLDQLVALTTQLQEDNSFGSFNIGIHNRVGKMGNGFYAVLGGSLPAVYFQQFKDHAAETDGVFLYMGLMLDIGELKKL